MSIPNNVNILVDSFEHAIAKPTRSTTISDNYHLWWQLVQLLLSLHMASLSKSWRSLLWNNTTIASSLEKGWDATWATMRCGGNSLTFVSANFATISFRYSTVSKGGSGFWMILTDEAGCRLGGVVHRQFAHVLLRLIDRKRQLACCRNI